MIELTYKETGQNPPTSSFEMFSETDVFKQLECEAAKCAHDLLHILSVIKLKCPLEKGKRYTLSNKFKVIITDE